MCDCFHLVLPTWPGAPGSVSGRQLQPEDPGAETEEDRSVTGGPVDEIIRPQPQGSSPVYECVSEGAGLALQEAAPGRPGSAGRRRSWWRRDSGDPRAPSRMSCPEPVQGASEVMLKTEVEVGASGYSVTGGGDQGIFVKQVLKESPAAKLFNLREGDQLLSATVFFDDIKYEDALKILQYSEPYKVQFQIRRKLPVAGGEDTARRGAQHGLEGPEKQDKEATDGCTDSPIKTLEEGGDRDRLLPKAREGRGRRPQRERVSWPKFQALRPKYGQGPRRSRSSSEAYERGASDVSPTSTDPEAQLPGQEQELHAGQRPRRFLSLRFRTRSGKPAQRAQGGPAPGVLEEAEFMDAGVRLSSEPSDLGEAVPVEMAGPVARRRKKKAKDRAQEEAAGQTGPEQASGENRDTEQGLTVGVTKPSLQDTTVASGMQSGPPEIRVRIPHLQTPRFGVPRQIALNAESGISEHELGLPPGWVSGEGPGPRAEVEGEAESLGAAIPQEDLPEHGEQRKHGQMAGQPGGIARIEDRNVEGFEGKLTMPKLKMPSFGWSPSKESKAPGTKHPTEPSGSQVTAGTASKTETGHEHDDKQQRTSVKSRGGRADGASLEGDVSLADKDMVTKDSKFKMPKFKMLSFGVSAPSKEVASSVDVSLPRVGVETSLPSLEQNIPDAEVKIQLLARDVDMKRVSVSVKTTEGEVSVGDTEVQDEGAGLRGTPPAGETLGPEMPEVGLTSPMVEVSLPDVDVAPPKVSVGAAGSSGGGVETEGDVKLRDKDIKTKDSKFKMPSFKMPSFGVSLPSKSTQESVDVSLPEAQAEVSLPSTERKKTGDLGIQIPSADVEVKSSEVGFEVPKDQLSKGELTGQAVESGLKGHLPKFQKPSVMMPKVGLKAPRVDIKGPKVDLKVLKGEEATLDVDMSLPRMEVDIQAPGTKVEGDGSLGDKDLATRDGKFKLPKFKISSCGISAPRKDLETSVDLPGPQVGVESPLPSLGVKITPAEGGIPVPSADMALPEAEQEMSLPEVEVAAGELKGKTKAAKIKGHLPKVQMPDVTEPRVDLKGPNMDIRLPEVDTLLPKVELDDVPLGLSMEGVKVKGDVKLEDKDIKTKDSKFKMPSLRTPSFDMSASGRSVEVPADVSLPKARADVSLPSVKGELKTGDLTVRLPSADVEVKGSELRMELAEGQLPEGQMLQGGISGKTIGGEVKGHLPKFQMPSMRMPKVDFKAPPVDIKGPKVGLKGSSSDMKDLKGQVDNTDVKVALPSVEVDIQVPGTKGEGDVALGDKDVAAKDSKFKMPKFKMPSFGVSATRKDLGPSVNLPRPKVGMESSMPTLGVQLAPGEGGIPVPSADVALPEAELHVSLPEVEAAGELKGKTEGAKITGHLTMVQVPDMKGLKVAPKDPKVDISLSEADLLLPKFEVDAPAARISMESETMEGGVKMEDKDIKTKDSRFKMLSFKMPSFGVSTPSKSAEASMDVSLPAGQVDVCLPSTEGEVETDDLSIQLPAADTGVEGSKVVFKIPEGQLSKEELTGQAIGSDMKGHLPKFQMPSVTMTKVDFKAPQVDIKGPHVDLKAPPVDLKDLKGEVATPDVHLSLPSMEPDIQGSGTQVEGDVSLGDKALTTKDSKFKMPKFKMPSFGVSVPSKSIKASADTSLKEAQVGMSLPSLKGEVMTGDLGTELPSADVEVKGGELTMKLAEGQLPEGQMPQGEIAGQAIGDEVKGHLPKFQVPHVKMPTVDFKSPQVDTKGPKVDLKAPKLDMKGLKGEVDITDVEVGLPSVEVDIQAPSAKVEGDLSLGDKGLAVKDSKLKMPKFKMPSFGVSVPSKSIKASADTSLKEAQVGMSLPSLKGEVMTGDLGSGLPSADVEVKGGELTMKLAEGQLPEGQMPQGEITGQAIGDEVKGHLPKFQVPRVKMPTVDFKSPQVDTKGPKVDLKAPKLDMKGFKGEVDITDVEVGLPSVEVDIQAPSAKVVGDLSLGNEGLAVKDSKLKMPKFKMPSFGVSVPSKSIKASADTSLKEAQVGMSLPSLKGEVMTGDLGSGLPSADVEVKGGELTMKLAEGQLPEGQMPQGEITGQAIGDEVKGHLPKFQIPRVRMPTVDFKSPQVDTKGPKVDLKAPKLDMKGFKGEVDITDVEVGLPSVEVDIQAPSAKVVGDLSLGNEGLAVKDSKLKMSKFKMPSFGVSVPSKSIEASLDTPLKEAQVGMSLPSLKGEVMTGDLGTGLPSADVEVKSGELTMKLAEGQLPEGQMPQGEITGQTMGDEVKGHLPKFQIPRVKMPTVDFKAPQVDTKGPKVDLKAPKLDIKSLKGEADITDVEVTVPKVEVDLEEPVAKVEIDVTLEDKDLTTKGSKFKMPKFKMPSFGISGPVKDLGSSVDLPGAKVVAESSLPSMELKIAPPEGSMPAPSADIILPGAELDVSLPEVEVAGGEPKGKTEGAKIKGHLPNVQMPDIKLPKVGLRGRKVDISLPEVDVSLPRAEVGAPTPKISTEGIKVEEEVKMEDKDIKTKDSKFKMPSFKMPSFDVSIPSKSAEASMDVSLPEGQVDVCLPSTEGEVQTGDLSVQLPAADTGVEGGKVVLKIPEGQLSKEELTGQAIGSDLKGHLPKFRMPSVTMPKVDFKAPQVDIEGPHVDLKGPTVDLKDLKWEVATPDVDLSLPSMEPDIQGSGTQVEGDVSLGDKALTTKDSKFKMPKFKMPSFGVSVPSKSIKASADTSLKEAQVGMSLPSLKREVMTGDLGTELPSADVEVKGGELTMKLAEGQLPEGQMPQGEIAGQAIGDEVKGHLPKFQVPRVKMPTVDFKSPQVDTKGPKVDLKAPKLDMKGLKGEVDITDVEVGLPSVEVDIQAPSAKVEGDLSLGDKGLAVKDSKLKMPKFKMPSFSVSVPSKSIKASADTSLKEAQVGMSLPSLKGEVMTGDLGSGLPSADVEVKGGELTMKLAEGQLPEGQMPQGEITGQAIGDEVKGHLPKFQVPRVKMPTVDFKSPQVDTKGPKVDLKAPKLDIKSLKGEADITDVEVTLPKVEVDLEEPVAKVEIDVTLEDKDLTTKGSKFKMPKFKMPSFGISGPVKDLGSSVDLPGAKVVAESSLPSMGVKITRAEGSMPAPSADIILPGAELDVSLPEVEVAGGEPKGKTEGAKIKGHLPNVQMPDIKLPKVGLRGRKVDISLPEVDMSLPRAEVGAPTPKISTEGIKVEEEVKMEDKDIKTKDSKFKMPSFKMPSFDVSIPSKSAEASMDVSLPGGQVDVCLPSTEGEVQTGDLSIQLPAADIGVEGGKVVSKIPEGQLSKEELTGQAIGSDLKGHLPKFRMPSFTMRKVDFPQVDIKGPHVELKGPTVDLKDLKWEVATPDVDLSLPSMEPNIQDSGTQVEGDMSLGDRGLAVKDSKLKMPKFKMPSFSVSVPSKPIKTSVDTSLKEAQVGVSLSSPMEEVTTSDLIIQLARADAEVKGGELTTKLAEGQLPEGQMPQGEIPGQAMGDEVKGHLPKFQIPRVTMPTVAFKASEVILKGLKVGEKGTPDMEVFLPSVEWGIQARGIKVEKDDVSLGDEDVTAKASGFQVPQGLSMPLLGESSLYPSPPAGGIRCPELTVSTDSVDLGHSAPGPDIPNPSVDLTTALPHGKDGGQCEAEEPCFRAPEGSLPQMESSKDHLALDQDSGPLPPRKVSAPPPDVMAGLSQEEAVAQGARSLLGLAGSPTAELDLHPLCEGRSVLPSSNGIALTRGQVVTRCGTAVHPELPAVPVSHPDVRPPGREGAAEQQHGATASWTETLPGPQGRRAPAACGGVTFPKFHKPKFGFSVVTEAVPDGGGSAAEKTEVSPLPSTVPPPADSPIWMGQEDHPGPDVTEAAAPGEAPTHETERGGEGGPSKMPRFKLPSLSWSPKKETVPQGDPEASSPDADLSLNLAPDQPGAQTAVCVPQMEADTDLPPKKDGPKGGVRKSSFAMPTLPFSKVKGTKGGPGLPWGGIPPGPSGSEAATGRIISQEGAAGRAPEGVAQDPTLGLTKPMPRPSEAEVEASMLEATTPLSEQDSSVQEGHRGLKDSPAHPLGGEGVASPTEWTPPQHTPLLDTDSHTVESLQGDTLETGMPVASKEGWFRVPKLHVPSFRRVSTRKGQAAAPGAPVPRPRGEGAAAGVQAQEGRVLGPVVQAAVSPVPAAPEKDAMAAATEDCADVLKRRVHSRGLDLSLPTVAVAAADLCSPAARVRPEDSSPSSQMPGRRLSAGQPSPGEVAEMAPPGPGARGPTVREGHAERQPARAEGPLKLKTSQTEMPTQVSVIRMDRLWEDSVVTVTFPKLKAPRFAFRAPYAEGDIFVPSVREVPGLGTVTEGESTGMWGASILKASAGVPAKQPGETSDSSEASPVSRVRVHLQDAAAEGRAVTACPGVTSGSTESLEPEAVSTQIVRESEVPASEIQMPSYGFSLLKVKIPEPHPQTRVHMAIHGSRAGEGVQEAPREASSEGDPISADLQPDTGEPFEIISCGVSEPRPPAGPPEAHAGPQLADSCSDEEPAEILEFPSEDSHEVATLPAEEGRSPKEKAAGKKPSGLFRFWLPSIGFSSSVEETSSDLRDAVQRPPIQTQPEAQPETERPRKLEKAGWFRFPKLGFSSPTKTGKSIEDEAPPAEPSLQDEGVAFFDARDSFTPEDKEEGAPEGEEGADPRGRVTPAASVEQTLLQQGEEAGGESVPRPAPQ